MVGSLDSCSNPREERGEKSPLTKDTKRVWDKELSRDSHPQFVRVLNKALASC